MTTVKTLPATWPDLLQLVAFEFVARPARTLEATGTGLSEVLEH